MIIKLRRAAAASALGLLAAGPISVAALNPAPAAASSTPAVQRVLATATLSQFKVVLTAARGPSSMATVTAAGYQQTTAGWKLISSKTVGQPDQWFWNSVDTCSFTVTQLKPLPSGAAPYDSMRVSLLMTPALGCSTTYHAAWKPQI
ncbi:MAG TPA: hypothetical protein VGH27_01870 [Streptosporangiaceae bacterium]|jgi:hypothetical protein